VHVNLKYASQIQWSFIYKSIRFLVRKLRMMKIHSGTIKHALTLAVTVKWQFGLQTYTAWLPNKILRITVMSERMGLQFNMCPKQLKEYGSFSYLFMTGRPFELGQCTSLMYQLYMVITGVPSILYISWHGKMEYRKKNPLSNAARYPTRTTVDLSPRYTWWGCTTSVHEMLHWQWEELLFWIKSLTL